MKPFYLCCPKSAEKYKTINSTYWYNILPHAAEIKRTTPIMSAEEPKDIDISPKGVTDVQNENLNNIRGESQTGKGAERTDTN